MSDDSKLQGLSFGRSLQVAWKITTIYSVDHPALQASLQQTFARLQTLLVGRPRFTFGFSDGRILLDNVLTKDVSLAALEAEFGIPMPREHGHDVVDAIRAINL